MASKILILGGGFAGAYCAQELEKRLGPGQADIILLNETNYFVFYPLLIEAGTGSLEPRHAVVSLRSFLRRAVFRMAAVRGVDFGRRTVAIESDGQQEELSYDQLVIALGSVTRLPNVPGLREFGFEIKNLSDAVALRDRAVEMLELADSSSSPERRRALLHFVVVGASFTGVEVAGEFDDFFRKARKVYRGIRPEECVVSLVEMSDRILPALNRELADYARQKLEGRGVHVYLNNSVHEIRPDSVHLVDGTQLPTHTVIWAAGVAPNPLVERLELPRDPRGYILCERDLRVRGLDSVWAIGDCASNPDPAGNPYPATAQHAVQEGRIAARNVARILKGLSTETCNIRSKGTLAALGCRTGIAEVFGFKLSGLAAWWLWRTVYLAKMPTWSRRLRVAIDWTLDALFKKDIVQLGVHRKRT